MDEILMQGVNGINVGILAFQSDDRDDEKKHFSSEIVELTKNSYFANRNESQWRPFINKTDKIVLVLTTLFLFH